MKLRQLLKEGSVKVGDTVTYTDGGIELKVLKIDDLGVHKLKDLEDGSIHHVPEDEFNDKYKLTEGLGVSKMSFSVDVFFDEKVTSKTDPQRIEDQIIEILERAFSQSGDAADYGVDDIRVRKD